MCTTCTFSGTKTLRQYRRKNGVDNQLHRENCTFLGTKVFSYKYTDFAQLTENHKNRDSLLLIITKNILLYIF